MQRYKKRISFFLFFLVSSVIIGYFAFSAFYKCNSYEYVDTLYGTCTVTEPVLCELLHSQAVNRLKYVHQYGVDRFIHKTMYPYTRHTHSLGVFVLLRKFGASLKEQIAGLLHDASHTVFSHVGDHVYAQMKRKQLNQNDEAYQDNMHLQFLAQTDIAPILAHHNIALSDIDHKSSTYSMLEKELPDMCADRIEYNLYGGYIEGWLTKEDINAIVNSLYYENNRWFFDDRYQAKKFAEISIRLCEEIFASDWNIGSYEWAAKALLRAVELNILSMHDIHFGRDDVIWKILCDTDDDRIKYAIQNVLHAKSLYRLSDEHDYDLCYVSKFRGIDPFVKVNGMLQKLSAIDPSFMNVFTLAKDRVCRIRYYKVI